MRNPDEFMLDENSLFKLKQLYVTNYYSQSSELNFLCYSRFPLAVYFTHGTVYMPTPVSQFVPTSLFYTWNCIYANPSLPICPNLPSSPCACQCPHIHSLCLCFYSCPGNRFICIIFLNSTYVLMTVF